MAGPTPISPEEWQKLYPDAPTETPVERIGQGLGKAWDFMFGRDPSMVNGQPTPQQEQAPQLATAPSPSVPTGMDSPAAQPTGIFGPSMQTPSATSAFGALPTIVPDVQAGAGSLTGMAPMGVSGLPTEGTYQQPQGSTFIDATPQPTGAMGVGETRAMFGGRTLSQYLSDPTVKGAGLMTDPQGRMIDPNVDRSKFEELSAARSAAAGPNLTSIAGRPRPGVDVPSLAMQRERMAAGLDPVEGAPMGTGMSQQQQRDYLAAGRDPATGKKIETDDMTDYQKATLAQRQQQFEATQANINREWEAGQAALAEEKAQGIAGTQESIQKETDRLNSQLGFLEGAAMEMAGLSNWTTEGIIGAGIGKLPFETNKKQVDRIANSFMGNAFLRSIIDSKSLGATFGALSNQEGEKITGAETILMDGSMSNERRLRAAADIISTIKSAKTRAEQRMAKTQGSVKSAPSASTGSATPQMEGFTFTRKN